MLIKTPPGSPLTEKIGYVVFDGLPKAFLWKSINNSNHILLQKNQILIISAFTKRIIFESLTDLSRPCILVGTSLYDPEMAIACTKLPFYFLYLYHLLNIVKQRYRDVWRVFVCINMNLFVTGDLHRAHNLQKQLKVMIICWIHLYHYELVLCYIGCLCFCLIVSILACNVLLMFQCSDSLWSFWWCM